MEIIKFIQIISAILLTIFIIAQQRGSGLGSIAGTSSNQVFTSRRGPEKIIFNATVVLLAVFVLSSLIMFIF
ncbi:preprotein translocase subunit SecG [Candidatus Peregrinibacteria bacterium RIFOXYB2_FULL_32_7]|nr:MAG: preprotein translocase subunit SecG [Candidatus Peregrinibacteria bacterium RIFOXYB2_FULL_32_7]